MTSSTLPSTDLKNKVVLVTGAAQGLGRYFAKLLAQAGALVVATDLTNKLSSLNDLVAEITKQGGAAIALDLDLRACDSFEAKVASIVKQTKHIDILVNNAGVSYYTKFFDIKEADWDIHMEANLKGVFFLTQAVTKEMIKQKIPGAVINIGSIAGSQTKKYHLPFCVSKAGLHHLTRLMAFELVDYGIRVNGIAPGLFPTELVQDYINSAAGKNFIEQIPLKRPGAYQELAGALLLLASDASSYMTGSIIEIDGGFASDVFLKEDFEQPGQALNSFFKTKS